MNIKHELKIVGFITLLCAAATVAEFYIFRRFPNGSIWILVPIIGLVAISITVESLGWIK